MNARFVTLVLLLFVWLEGDSVWAEKKRKPEGSNQRALYFKN